MPTDLNSPAIAGRPGAPFLDSVEEVDRWVAARRAAGDRIGYTCGAFDLLHAGHVDYLEAARLRCGRLLVAVNSDASVQRNKSPLRPIQPERQRARIVAALAAVDAVTLLDGDRPLEQLMRWRPDFYFKGGDYSPGRLRSADAVRSYGGEVVVLPLRYETSTSAIVQRIACLGLHAPPEDAARPSRLVFLDRDGTLIRDRPYLHEREKVELLPGVGEGLAALQAHGFALVIVTNQQGIGLGYYSVGEFAQVNEELFRQLETFGVKISRVYFCPHSAADACPCRKPGNLLIERALRWFGVPAGKCYLIGDRPSDLEAGRRSGCACVLAGEGASDFRGAVEWILSRGSGETAC